ncbi:PEP/pyruvate-binding domain-containing protein, partial [Desulfovibrio sp.]
MATVQKKAAAKKDAQKDASTPAKPVAEKDELMRRMVLTGPEIVAIGEDAELLVGGKNYNTAIISQVGHIRAPQFRAISSIAFHKMLDETRVNASVVRSLVDKEYNATDWSNEEINKDPEYLR